ncbi:hypothetical protein DM01DRAFT_323314 [Hesseltinella vesiculosa]|uniref:Uncharacterized protein n=1 Tax=Hesseltinella vesiculosa TaxID=101127 RepID=A0A1X2GJI7_9FUNG|nr:hypothetical protein DM01DRAFT_323314 [Hesseltinella vesiculosa]
MLCLKQEQIDINQGDGSAHSAIRPPSLLDLDYWEKISMEEIPKKKLKTQWESSQKKHLCHSSRPHNLHSIAIIACVCSPLMASEHVRLSTVSCVFPSSSHQEDWFLTPCLGGDDLARFIARHRTTSPIVPGIRANTASPSPVPASEAGKKRSGDEGDEDRFYGSNEALRGVDILDLVKYLLPALNGCSGMSGHLTMVGAVWPCQFFAID